METDEQVPAYSVDYSPKPLVTYASALPWHNNSRVADVTNVNYDGGGGGNFFVVFWKVHCTHV
jgi:hypothetical protein